jgi:hypothetical protein
MTLDKTVLKKMIDSAKPNDLIVATVSSLDKNSQKKAKAELDKFMIKSTDYVITIVRK